MSTSSSPTTQSGNQAVRQSSVQGKLPMSRETALRVAERLVELLRPGCERLAVAGSVRRGLDVVGDIELVYVPRIEAVATDLFGGQRQRSAVDPILDGLLDGSGVKEGPFRGRPVLETVQRGPINQRFRLLVVEPASQLDLFSSPLASYGVILAIRTGPRTFSKALVTPRSRGGRLDDSCRIAGGFRLWKRADALTAVDQPQVGDDTMTQDGVLYRELRCPEETNFLAHAGGWVKLEDRR